MVEHLLNREQRVNSGIEETFRFFSNAENLEAITPPELNFRIISNQPVEICSGSLIEYNLKLYGFPLYWKTEISEWEPPYCFVDRALESPYSQWIHKHTFSSIPDGGTEIIDEVRYRLPFAPFGNVVHWLVRRELEIIFDYRRARVDKILSNNRRSSSD